MDNTTALNKIRTLLGFSTEEAMEETTQESTKVEESVETFASASAEDGTIFQVEGEWAVGKEVVIVLEDGTTPAPSGIFDLDNGFTISIEEGILVEVKETEVKEEEPTTEDTPQTEEPTEEETSKEEEKMSDDQLVELISKVVKEVKDQMSAELAEVKSLVEGTQSEVKSLETEVENFKKAPASKKITNSVFESLKDYNNSSDDKFNKIKELRKNLNK